MVAQHNPDPGSGHDFPRLPVRDGAFAVHAGLEVWD